jgi:predicted lipid-binding transport protein (Tim44 family)
MQKSKSTLAILAALALALACGFFIGRKAPPVSDAAANKPGLPADGKGSSSAQTATPSPVNTSVLAHRTARGVGANSSTVKAPLPPAKAPLKQTYNELEARAAAGDSDAASRLYQDVRRCAARRDYQKSLTMLLPSLHTEGSNAMA